MMIWSIFVIGAVIGFCVVNGESNESNESNEVKGLMHVGESIEEDIELLLHSQICGKDFYEVSELLAYDNFVEDPVCDDNGECTYSFTEVRLMFGAATYPAAKTEYYLLHNYIMSFTPETTYDMFLKKYDWDDGDADGTWQIMARMVGIVAGYKVGGQGVGVRVGSGFLLSDDTVITARHNVHEVTCVKDHVLMDLQFAEMHLCKEENRQRLELSYSSISHSFETNAQKIFEHGSNVIYQIDRIIEDTKYEIGDADIALVKLKTSINARQFDGSKEFSMTICQENSKVTLFGFAAPITSMQTLKGQLNIQKYGGFYLPHHITIAKGKIIKSECQDKYTFDLEGLNWHGFSGGIIALRNDSTKICGVISGAKAIGGEFNRHHAVCANHPMFEKDFEFNQFANDVRTEL